MVNHMQTAWQASLEQKYSQIDTDAKDALLSSSILTPLLVGVIGMYCQSNNSLLEKERGLTEGVECMVTLLNLQQVQGPVHT